MDAKIYTQVVISALKQRIWVACMAEIGRGHTETKRKTNRRLATGEGKNTRTKSRDKIKKATIGLHRPSVVAG